MDALISGLGRAVEELIDETVGTAICALDAAWADTAHLACFPPRRSGDGVAALRTLDDPGIVSQLDCLLRAGLRVSGRQI
ncbi:MAG: hypothetical protein ABW167_20750 [Baekduia sp.]